mgnify:FL=1
MIGKHFVVIGGTSGLGLAIVNQLLKKDARVTLLVRNVEKFKQLHFTYSNLNQINVLYCDLQVREDINQIAPMIKKPIDGFIYSSGGGYFKSLDNHTSDEVIETYNVNLLSFNLLYKVLKPQFVKRAHVVGISSQAAFVTQANAAHYGASKAAFTAVLNTLRLEEPSFNVLLYIQALLVDHFIKRQKQL